MASIWDSKCRWREMPCRRSWVWNEQGGGSDAGVETIAMAATLARYMQHAAALRLWPLCMLQHDTSSLHVHRRAVNPNPEPDWSAAHRGLCLYIARLLQPVWDMRITMPSKAEGQLQQIRLSMSTMTVSAGV